MKLQECIEILKTEKNRKIASRFPCRAIMLCNREDYSVAISELKSLCDRTVTSDELFCGADVMPSYDKLVDVKKPDEWVLLPGVSDYLSLFSKSELRSERLHNLWHSIVDAKNIGRVIIPLCNADALWHDKSLGMDTDERQNDFTYIIDSGSTETAQRNITVFSSAFEEYIGQLSGKYTLLVGLREWYERILDEVCLPDNYYLLTRQARSAVPSASIHVVNDTCSFVKGNLLNGNVLEAKELTNEVLDELFEESMKNISLYEAILHRFNVVSFDGLSIMANWNSLSVGKKQLLKIWYRLNPDSSYLSRCFNEYESDEIAEHILMDIFDVMQYHPEWIGEAQQLVKMLNIQKTDAFFAKLDNIPVFEDRFPFLSGNTKDEHIYIIRMIGQWLKKDAEQALKSEQLAEAYPLLHSYLNHLPESIEPVFEEYIADYKAHKLANTLPDSEDIFFRGIKPDTLPYRYAILQKYVKENTVILWIDAMGFEYLSILISVISQNSDVQIVATELTQALLPTETKYNDQWNQMSLPHDKLDKLDKLAHKGVVDDPDYYTCIEEQFSFFEKVYDKVNELLDQYQRIIVTGDHGTSRLAARFFHSRDGLPLISGAKALSHGRYCSITSIPTVTYESQKIVSDSTGQKYLVLTNYDHFVVGGFAAGGDDENVIYGEVHGGASPEEMIVPVVVLDNKSVLPLSVKWAENLSTAKIKKHVAKAKLEFSREIQTLQVKVGSFDATSTREDKNTWTISIEKIVPGEYVPIIVADGKLVNIEMPLTIVSALGGGGDI